MIRKTTKEINKINFKLLCLLALLAIAAAQEQEPTKTTPAPTTTPVKPTTESTPAKPTTESTPDSTTTPAPTTTTTTTTKPTLSGRIAHAEELQKNASISSSNSTTNGTIGETFAVVTVHLRNNWLPYTGLCVAILLAMFASQIRDRVKCCGRCGRKHDKQYQCADKCCPKPCETFCIPTPCTVGYTHVWDGEQCYVCEETHQGTARRTPK